MARIGGANTAPEVALRRALWAAGVRYRLQFRTPGGRADVAVPSKRFALFVDGCFWHGCPEHYVRPRSSNVFWDNKLRENVDRDRRQTKTLLAEDWRFVRVWEHEVREHLELVVEKVLDVLHGRTPWTAGDWRVGRVEFLDDVGARERRHLESLLDPALRRTEEGARSTAKVGRVSREQVRSPRHG
jgi:DNA mismatch endonuclease (patch repair protein)